MAGCGGDGDAAKDTIDLEFWENMITATSATFTVTDGSKADLGAFVGRLKTVDNAKGITFRAVGGELVNDWSRTTAENWAKFIPGLMTIQLGSTTFGTAGQVHDQEPLQIIANADPNGIQLARDGLLAGEAGARITVSPGPWPALASRARMTLTLTIEAVPY